MIAITEKAGKKLQETIDKEGKAGAGIRIAVVGGGCSGFQYEMSLEELGQKDDIIVRANGVSVFVDPTSFLYLDGAEVDYQETVYGGGFTFKNPNVKGTCGCGHSFSA